MQVPSGPPDPAPSASYRPDAAEVAAARALLARILTENIAPFWYEAAIDRQDGGYRLNHDPEGRWKGRADKTLILQTRTLWFFSRLARSPYGRPEHVQAARHGYEFLRDRMLDRRFGGFYWQVDSAGRRATGPYKLLLGQIYVLYALAEYARSSDDSAPVELARQLFGLLEDHAYDAAFGGYREIFRPDWSAAPDEIPPGYGSARPDRKSFGTHFHAMEALTSHYLVTRDPVAQARLVELIMINSSSVVHKRAGACLGKYRLDWTPLRGGSYDLVTYGHDVENVWLLIEACSAAGLSNHILLDLYRALFAYALAYGFDRAQGGFYEHGPLHGPAIGRDKVWWVQAEALLGALHMYRLTGEQPYFTCFARTLDWIARRQVDWRHGDWHARVLESGQIRGDKAGTEIKGPYHNGRAVIECLSLLSAIEGPPDGMPPCA